MSKREQIVDKIFNLLKEQRSVKLGVVSRDPIIATELPRTGFPAVHIESSNEEREYLAGGMQEQILEIELVITVNGKSRDKQRNAVAEAIEDTLNASTELKNLVTDARVSRLEQIDLGEASPYASIRMIVETKSCITI